MGVANRCWPSDRGAHDGPGHGDGVVFARRSSGFKLGRVRGFEHARTSLLALTKWPQFRDAPRVNIRRDSSRRNPGDLTGLEPEEGDSARSPHFVRQLLVAKAFQRKVSRYRAREKVGECPSRGA